MSFTHGGGSGGRVTAANVTYDNATYPNVDAALDSLLYVPLQITSFTTGLGVQLKGSVLESVTLTWAFNHAIVSQTVAGVAIGAAARTRTIVGLVSVNTTYTMSASDGTGTDTASVAVRFSNDRFWGVGAAGLTGADLDTLSGTDRPATETKAKTFTVTAGPDEKIYYAWPKRLGLATFTVGGFSGGFTVSEGNYTNGAGYTETYYIAESSSANLGVTTVNAS